MRDDVLYAPRGPRSDALALSGGPRQPAGSRNEALAVAEGHSQRSGENDALALPRAQGPHTSGQSDALVLPGVESHVTRGRNDVLAVAGGTSLAARSSQEPASPTCSSFTDDDSVEVKEPSAVLKAMHALRAKVQEITPYQLALGLTAMDLVCYSLVASAVLIIFGMWYVLGTVYNTQEWYVLYGSAARAAAVAVSTLDVAVQAQTALHGTACAGLLSGSSDSAAYERALTSILLVKRMVRSVELSFIDKHSVVSLSSKRARGDNWIVDTTSNEDACFLFGPSGCASFPGASGTSRPSWAQEVLAASTGEQLLPEGGWDCERGSDWGTRGWDDFPVLLEHELEAEPDSTDESIATALFPSYRYVFRAVLPDPNALGLLVSFAGRVTLEVGELSGVALQDSTLGDEAAVYLCDLEGLVIAAPDPSTMLKLVDGRLTFRQLTELPGMNGFTELPSIFDGAAFASGRQLRHSSEGWLLVVHPLPAPHDRFAIVAVSPESGPFTDYALYVICIVALVLAFIPYAVFGCGIGGLCIVGGQEQMPALYVSKWVDCSRKHGMCYLLSDGCLGVYFNDRTKMITDSVEASKFDFITCGTPERPQARRTFGFSSYPDQLQEKVTQFRNLRTYILTGAGALAKRDLGATFGASRLPPPSSDGAASTAAALPFVDTWFWSDGAVIFRLTSSSVQVVFGDGTEAILSSKTRRVTYVDERGQAKTYPFTRAMGVPNEELGERLQFHQDALLRLLEPGLDRVGTVAT